MDFKYLKKQLTRKLFNEVDDMVADLRYGYRAIDNLEKSNLNRRDKEDW